MARAKAVKSSESPGPARSTAGPAWSSAGSPGRRALVIFFWALVVHLVYLVTSGDRSAPVSAFFFGDGRLFLALGQALSEGRTLGAGLPYHPPLLPWLAAGLWSLFGSPALVFLAAKTTMIVAAAATYAVFFRVIRERVPRAFWICLLLPLSFGELLLGSSLNSEVVYRLLLVLVLWNGFERPALCGALNGLAALARAEHLPFALAVAAVLAWRQPERRRFLAVAAGAGLLVLAPYLAWTAHKLSDYNRQHRAQLAEPLPVFVPITFYGPLNFALAQRETEVTFSRRSLPPAPGGATELDPTFPPHHEAIVHGYRMGFAAIADDPGRFLARSWRKLALSAQALGHGWTWRDLPKDPAWTRPAVDLAYSPSTLATLVGLVLTIAGACQLREQRLLLLVGGVILASRLGVNVAFFPYLRSVAVVTPFLLTLALSGFATPFRHHGRRVLQALLVLLAIFHFATAFGDRPYSLAGERDGSGQIIDDREVRILLRESS